MPQSISDDRVVRIQRDGLLVSQRVVAPSQLRRVLISALHWWEAPLDATLDLVISAGNASWTVRGHRVTIEISTLVEHGYAS